jgi:hypothetical protein
MATIRRERARIRHPASPPIRAWPRSHLANLAPDTVPSYGHDGAQRDPSLQSVAYVLPLANLPCFFQISIGYENARGQAGHKLT